MNFKTRKPFQIGAVLLALMMLASYVVYSQRQGSQNVTPGSKSGGIDVALEPAAIQQEATSTNKPLQRSLTVVAPSSKSMSPVLTLPAATSSKTAKGPGTNQIKLDLRGTPREGARPIDSSHMVFPGSKSAAVFHPQDVPILMPHSASDVNSFPAPPQRRSQYFESTTLPLSTGTNATLPLKP